MKISKKLLFILLTVAIALGGGVYYFSGTPEYSLYKIRRSVENHNWNEFRNYVNVDKIMDNSIDVFTSLHLNDGSEADSSAADTSAKQSINMGSIMTKGFMFFLKPQLKKMLNAEVKYFIDHGEFEKRNDADQLNNEMSLAAYWNILNPASSFKERSMTKVDSDVAVSSFTFDLKGAPLRVDIKMAREGHQWRITEVSNLKEVLETLEKAR